MTAIHGESEMEVVTDNGSTGTADSADGAGATAAKKSTVRSQSRGQASARGARAVARQKSEPELLADISAKLDRVVAVLAAQGKDRDTQVAILATAGCDSVFIGTLVGMSAGAVRKLPGWRRAQGNDASNASEDHT